MFSYDSPGEGIRLNESGQVTLDFRLIVVDKDFDNDHNPYGSFIYHMYTNMDHFDDTGNVAQDADDNTESLYGFYDQTIPLIICPE